LAGALADARARAAARAHGSVGPILPITTPPGAVPELPQGARNARRRQGRETLPVITPPRPSLVATVVPPPVAVASSTPTLPAAVATAATTAADRPAATADRPAATPVPTPPAAPQPAPARVIPSVAPTRSPAAVAAEPPPAPQPTRAEKLAEERKRKAEAAAKAKAAADKAAAQAQAKLEKANPARHWVQVAGGANKADLGRAWDALKEKWGKQLAGRSPWTTHYRFTNRLLIGPFASSDAAQDWVSDRKKEGFATFRVETNAGDPVERVKD
jgi:hypothetical protein